MCASIVTIQKTPPIYCISPGSHGRSIKPTSQKDFLIARKNRSISQNTGRQNSRVRAGTIGDNPAACGDFAGKIFTRHPRRARRRDRRGTGDGRQSRQGSRCQIHRNPDRSFHPLHRLGPARIWFSQTKSRAGVFARLKRLWHVEQGQCFRRQAARFHVRKARRLHQTFNLDRRPSRDRRNSRLLRRPRKRPRLSCHVEARRR